MTWRRAARVLVVGALRVLAPPVLAGAATAAPGGVTVSGTVTDATTGTPIVGASVWANGGGENQGKALTDARGHFVRQVPPGRYMFWVEADGYYRQPIGAELADISSGAEVVVTAAGPNDFPVAMVPKTQVHIGVDDAGVSWAHARSKPFESMVIFLRFGAFVSAPPTWPRDELVIQVIDVGGRVLDQEQVDVFPGGSGDLTVAGGALSAFPFGSATRCGYFDTTTPPRPDPLRLRVRAFLRSQPSRATVRAVAADRSGCAQTMLDVRTTRARPHRAIVRVRLRNRARSGHGIAGTVTFLVNGRHRVRAPLPSHTSSLRRNLARWLHPGRNVLRVSFAPTTRGFSQPPSRRLVWRVAR